MTVHELQQALDRLDDGVLLSGAHRSGDKAFCVLEFSAAVRQKPHSDDPGDLPDLRQLNDGPWSSDQVRTAHLLPVMAAYWDWGTWTAARQLATIQRVAILTVHRLVATLPGLPDDVRAQCRAAHTLAQAESAATRAVIATSAVMAADAAARAAWRCGS